MKMHKSAAKIIILVIFHISVHLSHSQPIKLFSDIQNTMATILGSIQLGGNFGTFGNGGLGNVGNKFTIRRPQTRPSQTTTTARI